MIVRNIDEELHPFSVQSPGFQSNSPTLLYYAKSEVSIMQCVEHPAVMLCVLSFRTVSVLCDKVQLKVPRQLVRTIFRRVSITWHQVIQLVTSFHISDVAVPSVLRCIEGGIIVLQSAFQRAVVLRWDPRLGSRVLCMLALGDVEAACRDRTQDPVLWLLPCCHVRRSRGTACRAWVVVLSTILPFVACQWSWFAAVRECTRVDLGQRKPLCVRCYCSPSVYRSLAASFRLPTATCNLSTRFRGRALMLCAQCYIINRWERWETIKYLHAGLVAWSVKLNAVVDVNRWSCMLYLVVNDWKYMSQFCWWWAT